MGAALPAGWSAEPPRRAGGRLLIIVIDPAGRRHELVGEPAGGPALVTGARFGWSYRGAAQPSAGDLADYRAILERLAASDGELWPVFESSRDTVTARPQATEVRFLPESRLRLRTLAPGAVRVVPAVKGAAQEIHLFLESPCAQACEFCEVPQRKGLLSRRLVAAAIGAHHRAGLDVVSTGQFDRLVDACAASEPPATLVITGFDWSTHPQLDAILSRLEREQRVPVRFLGPSTALADRALASRVAKLPTLQHVVLTLQSADDARHDAMVGRPGAAAALRAALANLSQLGVPTRVNVVLTKRAVEDLPSTLATLFAGGHVARLVAFLPDRVAGWDPTPVMASPASIRAALEASVTSLDAVESIGGVPHCAVPPSQRFRLATGALGHRAEGLTQPPGCVSCALKAACPGVPASFAARFADAVLPEIVGDPAHGRDAA